MLLLLFYDNRKISHVNNYHRKMWTRTEKKTQTKKLKRVRNWIWNREWKNFFHFPTCNSFNKTFINHLIFIRLWITVKLRTNPTPNFHSSGSPLVYHPKMLSKVVIVVWGQSRRWRWNEKFHFHFSHINSYKRKLNSQFSFFVDEFTHIYMPE